MRRASVAVALVTLLWAAAPGFVRAEAPSSREHALKAAFLYNFLRFVEWPNGAARAPTVCVVGGEAFAQAVEGALRGKLVDGKEVSVRRLAAPKMAEGCTLLFVPDASLDEWPRLQASLACEPVLAVGESAAFLSAGGSISLFADANRLRFDVNRAAAGCGGLRYSSRLLSLARAVDGKRAER